MLYFPSLQNVIVSLIPMIIGMLWYHPKAFGTVWMKGARLTQADTEGISMPIMMGVGYICAFIISLFLRSYAIFHEGDPTEQTFVHGMFHGVMLTGMIGIPVMVSSTLWERKSIQYYLINISYWLVVAALMGGILFVWRNGYAEIAASLHH